MTRPVFLYVVRYMLADLAHTHTSSDGPWDYWRNAKSDRDWIFGHMPTVARCWIERTVEGRTVARSGALLERTVNRSE